MVIVKAADIGTFLEGKKRGIRELVVKKSIQDLSEIAQTPKAKGGRLPVDTGLLRNSFSAGLNGSTSLTGPDVYAAVIAGMEMGDTFIGGWPVSYALRQERGFIGTDSLGRAYNQPGSFFMEGALAQWQQINEANARRIAG